MGKNDVSRQFISSAARGDVEEIRRLLDAGADAMKTGPSRKTALMAAAANGHAPCVELLLPLSNANTREKTGWTALMWAAKHGSPECVKLLLRPSSARMVNKEGWTALMLAARHGNHDCVRLLLPSSRALATDRSEWTAADHARSKGHASISMLIEGYVRSLAEMGSIKKSLPKSAKSPKPSPRRI